MPQRSLYIKAVGIYPNESAALPFGMLKVALSIIKSTQNLYQIEFNLGSEGKLKTMLEFRWHGRGGQGAWTASELLARTAIAEGKYIQSFPEFGPERMGAPVTAFTRISAEPIRLHCAIYDPDVVVVLDNTLLKTVPVTSGINQDDDVIIVNSTEDPATVRKNLKVTVGKVWTVPATEIALRILGAPITNTALLGAVAKATGAVTMKGIEKTVRGRFKAELAEKNIAVIKEAYKEAKGE
jgi:2-oxoacid:acceptor oxidoreductase gamma subunit (pyruvate/2-ketoisovalerate family)